MVRANTPSSTRAWTCTWRFTDPPKRWMTATPPPRGSARPWSRAQPRRCRSTARCSRRATRRHRSWCQASTYRIRCGTLKTHWRTGTSGKTWSTRCAARSAMRRPPQLGQKPRPLHENATSRSVRQSPHRNRAKPPARNPHRRNARNSSSTNRGNPSPSRSRADSTRNVSKWSRTTVYRTDALGSRGVYSAGRTPAPPCRDGANESAARRCGRGRFGRQRGEYLRTHRPRRDGGIARVGALHTTARASGRRAAAGRGACLEATRRREETQTGSTAASCRRPVVHGVDRPVRALMMGMGSSR